jgi:hypothetical protein
MLVHYGQYILVLPNPIHLFCLKFNEVLVEEASVCTHIFDGCICLCYLGFVCEYFESVVLIILGSMCIILHNGDCDGSHAVFWSGGWWDQRGHHYSLT